MNTTPSVILYHLRRLDRTVVLTAWRTLVVTLVASGLLLTVVRLMLPGIENYRSEVARWVSTLLGQPVSIGGLRASWHGWTPELHIEDVRLLSRSTGQTPPRTLVHFADALVSINPLASLQTGEFRPGEITVSGVLLAITRKADGSFVFEGLDSAKSPLGDIPQSEDLARWLLRQNLLRLRSTTILWTNATSKAPPLLFTDVGLKIRNTGSRHQIEGTVKIPKELGNQITFAFDITGDVLTPAWSGQIFLRGEKIDVGILRFAREVLGIDTVAGPADFDFWSDWSFGNLTRAQGQFALHDATFGTNRVDIALKHARGEFALARNKHAWDLKVENIHIQTSSGVWPKTNLQGHYVPQKEDGLGQISGSISHLPLTDVLPILAQAINLEQGLDRQLTNWQPQGRLEDLRFEGEIGNGTVLGLKLDSRLEAVNTNNHDSLPTLHNVTGRLEVGREKLLLSIESGAADIPLTGVFPKALELANLEGDLIWSSVPDGWQLEARKFHAANSDLGLMFNSTVRWRDSARLPDVSMVAHLASADLKPLPRYLPTGLISKPVTDWIEQALTDGRLRRGEIILRGNLSDFPFHDGNGSVDGSAGLVLNSLHYAPGWPALKAVEGRINFHGPEIHALIDKAHIFGSTIDNAQIDIDNLLANIPEVKILGHATGPTQDAGKYLNASPPGERFRQVVEHLTATGESTLDLNLNLPLGPGQSTVSGALSVHDSMLSLPGLARGLEGVNGEILFDHSGIRAERITASYLDNPMAVRIENVKGAQAATRIRIIGRASKEYLVRHMHNAGAPAGSDLDSVPWLNRVTGDTQWTAQIDVPHRSISSGVIARVQVESDLVGAALDLPSPFGKLARERTQVQVDSEFESSGVRRMTVRYGKHANGEFEFHPSQGKYHLTRGAIGIGSQLASLPKGETVNITGNIERLEPAEWLEIVRPSGNSAGIADTANSTTESTNKSAQIEHLDLRIGQLNTLGSQFNRVHLSAIKQANNFWSANLSGGIRGEILIPPRGDISPIRANIERLIVSSGNSQLVNFSAHPQNIPAIEFRCEALTYNDIDLGLTTITTEPRTDGMHIKRLHAQSGPFEALANGEWLLKDGRHHSRISMEVSSGDLGQLLGAFGYASDEVDGGTANIQLDAKWDGQPMSFDIKQVSGLLRFKANEGTLVNVNRGATGRIFGLLSVTSLPRRLSLDFSDLFGKGLKYDRIEGSFSIEHGDAYTNNLVMHSSSATVEIAGRTGLVTEDYDQLVTVTPKLSTSIPFAAIWLVEKVINKQIFDKVFAQQYTITGSWQKPVIEPVQVEEIPRVADDNG